MCSWGENRNVQLCEHTHAQDLHGIHSGSTHFCYCLFPTFLCIQIFNNTKKIHVIRQEIVSPLKWREGGFTSLFWPLTPLFSPPLLRIVQLRCYSRGSSLLLSVPVLRLQNFSRNQLSPQNQAVGRQISEPHIKLLMNPPPPSPTPRLSWGFVLRHAGTKQRCRRNRLDLSSSRQQLCEELACFCWPARHGCPAATAPPRGHTGIADKE